MNHVTLVMTTSVTELNQYLNVPRRKLLQYENKNAPRYPGNPRSEVALGCVLSPSFYFFSLFFFSFLAAGGPSVFGTCAFSSETASVIHQCFKLTHSPIA